MVLGGKKKGLGPYKKLLTWAGPLQVKRGDCGEKGREIEASGVLESSRISICI